MPGHITQEGKGNSLVVDVLNGLLSLKALFLRRKVTKYLKGL
jgi:hypothetical protein